MAVKHYVIKQHWLDFEVTLEVDHDVLTVERAHEINNFWSNAEDRVEDEEGDVVRSVIKQVAQCFMRLMVEQATTYVPRLQDDFNREEGYGGSGYSGIKLIDCDGQIEILLEDLEMAEAKVSDPVVKAEG